MDDLDRLLINRLQRGLPLVRHPWEVIAQELHGTPEDLLDRVHSLLEDGVLTRFGPMFDIERLGGAFTLAALSVPEARFEPVTVQLNELPQVAHNYRREHHWNMWFVLACATADELAVTLSHIHTITGLQVLNLPKEQTYHVGLYFPV
ncbi:Lrp/AsnC family transcriptional regulator [Pseudomonas mucidolens]|uniref:siroheme decarboxylase n=1 Tax=Pseudomonas mucidolens TaxID=46679 RepID=A0A1H2MHG0_9PSED|nr:Lrp/AsnC family transcriptional regulator [Pseudomonas mucidolens]SDU92465.1 transcriptional regulator, AsnC family [Pseudomonas mucidolens]SQH33882.1 putative heme biosynthesis protein [Pseudomonas mucidolens]